MIWYHDVDNPFREDQTIPWWLRRVFKWLFQGWIPFRVVWLVDWVDRHHRNTHIWDICSFNPLRCCRVSWYRGSSCFSCIRFPLLNSPTSMIILGGFSFRSVWGRITTRFYLLLRAPSRMRLCQACALIWTYSKAFYFLYYCNQGIRFYVNLYFFIIVLDNRFYEIFYSILLNFFN